MKFSYFSVTFLTAFISSYNSSITMVLRSFKLYIAVRLFISFQLPLIRHLYDDSLSSHIFYLIRHYVIMWTIIVYQKIASKSKKLNLSVKAEKSRRSRIIGQVSNSDFQSKYPLFPFWTAAILQTHFGTEL